MKAFYGSICILWTELVFGQSTSHEVLRQQMIKDWERAKVYSQEYLDAMPADKYSLKPVDGIRTFAEQMLHFAMTNTGMGSIATGIRTDEARAFYATNFGKSEASQKKDSVVYYVNKSYDLMISYIKSFDFNRLTEEVSRELPGGKRTATRLGWLLKAFEHQTHHRGQCTIYLRLAGVKPPNERIWD